MVSFKPTISDASEGSFLAGQSPEMQEEKLAFIVMSIDGETFAIDISKVLEIIRVPKITWIPGASVVVRGLINLRGKVVVLLDLGRLLSLSPSQQGNQSRIIVIETSKSMVGFLVDSVKGVSEVSAQSLEEPLRTLEEFARSCIIAQANIEGVMTGILSVEQIIENARLSGEKQSA